MGEITTVGIDLAKNVVSVHGVDAHGKTETVLRKTVSRGALLELMAQLPRCLIGMEACSGAHQLARDLQPLGHQPRIMMPKFIIPYRRNQKNDGNDAEAICEAAARPNMRFVPIKSVERQVLHEVNARSLALDEDILAYDGCISAQVRDSAAMQRIVAVCGVGPITASAVVASVSDAKLFRNGRQFAAWLGWCRGSSPPAASRCSGSSPGRAMCTCARC
jgi:transposase